MLRMREALPKTPIHLQGVAHAYSVWASFSAICMIHYSVGLPKTRSGIWVEFLRSWPIHHLWQKTAAAGVASLNIFNIKETEITHYELFWFF
jgi:hypothetical protein